MPRNWVLASAAWARMPMWRTTSRAVPRMSIACPPDRGAAARSTITGVNPRRASQCASVSPATPPPEMRMVPFRIECSPSRQSVVASANTVIESGDARQAH